jgi:pyridoxal 5'-phosphate synthase glutaminase subunit Pdx2
MSANWWGSNVEGTIAAGLASVTLKGDEPALLALAEQRGWPLRLYAAERLAAVPVPNPSEAVAREVGTASVAEAAARLAAAEAGGTPETPAPLLRAKRIERAGSGERGAATLAVALSSQQWAPGRGALPRVGSGPGRLDALTGEARAALAAATVWVGYGLYLDLLEPLRRRLADGMPAYGSCAGMILLATEILDAGEPGRQAHPLGAIDMTVRRNAFGRQVDSFEGDIDVLGLDEPVRAVFIRAPWVERIGPGVEVLARADGHIVAVRQGPVLATAFHPESSLNTIIGLFNRSPSAAIDASVGIGSAAYSSFAPRK